MRLPIVLTLIALFSAGLVSAWWTYPRAVERRTKQLIADARRGAIAFAQADLDRLNGTPEDATSASYTALKDRLMKLRAIDERVRFCYLMRRTADGTIVFLGDSEPENSEDISRPGDVYTEAPQSYGLQATLLTGEPSWEGPLRDSFGTWVTGFAVSATHADGTVRDIFGIDVQADDWLWGVWQEALKSAFVVWLAIGSPLILWAVLRRRLRLLTKIRHLTEALDESSAAVLVLRRDGTISYANGGFTRQTGTPTASVLDQHWKTIAPSQLDRAALASVFRTLRNGTPWRGQWDAARSDGSTYPVYGMISVVPDRRGRRSGYVVVYDDISIIKKAEAELRLAKEHAEAANAAKSQFLATMSHEIRTPLNGVIGLASVLRGMRLTQEQRDIVDIILNSGETLLVVINDILDLARIDSGKVELETRPFNLHACVEDTVALFRPLANEKKLHLSLVHHDDVPRYASGDPARLSQILSNLVANAVKFTEYGSITVVTSVRQPTPGDFIFCVTVTDTGIGIPKEKQERLFAPFNQLDASITRRFGGTGLGLAICKRLSELMGGSVTCESEPGKGSSFVATVRLNTTHEDVPSRPVPTETTASNCPTTSSLKLLLVEDNVVNRVVAEKMLSTLGYRADVATDGQAAVDACTANAYDIVLMDLQMPQLDGLTAARRIRALSLEKQPWIIALTANALADDRQKCLVAGMNDYVPKPLTIETLSDALNRATTSLLGYAIPIKPAA